MRIIPKRFMPPKTPPTGYQPHIFASLHNLHRESSRSNPASAEPSFSIVLFLLLFLSEYFSAFVILLPFLLKHSLTFLLSYWSCKLLPDTGDGGYLFIAVSQQVSVRQQILVPIRQFRQKRQSCTLFKTQFRRLCIGIIGF